jgi:hypothetical protein
MQGFIGLTVLAGAALSIGGGALAAGAFDAHHPHSGLSAGHGTATRIRGQSLTAAAPNTSDDRFPTPGSDPAR